MKNAVFVSCLAIFAATNMLLSPGGSPDLTGPYFGQKPPGKAAEPFGLAIPGLHQNVHSALIFSPDGKEAYWKPGWNPRDPIYMSRIENGRWSTPAVASFSAADRGDDSPFISPDGKRLYFLSQRTERGQEMIWVMERAQEGWLEPKVLPIKVESWRMHWQLSVDGDQNIFFGAGNAVDGEVIGDIYCSKYEDGQYGPPEKLGPAVNQAGEYNYSPFIAPDGSYLLFTRSQKPAKIYISYRKKDGTWTSGRDLSKIIQSPSGLNPFVTADGKYLFFVVGGPVHWVDASFIEELRPNK